MSVFIIGLYKGSLCRGRGAVASGGDWHGGYGGDGACVVCTTIHVIRDCNIKEAVGTPHRSSHRLIPQYALVQKMSNYKGYITYGFQS